MNNEAMDLSKWFSSYGLITAERILEGFQIKLSHETLLSVIKTPNSLYHLLLLVPVQNVMNGIIAEQAKEYHLYIQKRFIDYLMSGEDNKTESSPGASTRETIESMRKVFMEQAELFEKLDDRQLGLIAESQAEIIKYSKKWKAEFESISQALSKATGNNTTKKEVIDCINRILSDTPVESFAAVYEQRMTEILNIDRSFLQSKPIENELQSFIASFSDLQGIIVKYSDRAIENREQFKNYRQIFYDTILQISETMSYLSEYYLNLEQDKMNKELLDFDTDVI